MACGPAMRVSTSALSIPVAQTRLPSDAIAERRQSPEAPPQRQAREQMSAQMSAQASIPSAAMSFAINLRGNSITVTLADRISGEVLRQLVYEFGGLPRPSSEASGRLIDIRA